MSTITKAELHRIIDELADQDLAAVSAFAEFLYRRRVQPELGGDGHPDSLLAFLAAAPLDDEGSSPEEDASADEAWREVWRGDYSDPHVTAELLGGSNSG